MSFIAFLSLAVVTLSLSNQQARLKARRITLKTAQLFNVTDQDILGAVGCSSDRRRPLHVIVGYPSTHYDNICTPFATTFTDVHCAKTAVTLKADAFSPSFPLHLINFGSSDGSDDHAGPLYDSDEPKEPGDPENSDGDEATALSDLDEWKCELANIAVQAVTAIFADDFDELRQQIAGLTKRICGSLCETECDPAAFSLLNPPVAVYRRGRLCRKYPRLSDVMGIPASLRWADCAD